MSLQSNYHNTASSGCSSHDAPVLTVSPKRQKRGMRRPTTPDICKHAVRHARRLTCENA